MTRQLEETKTDFVVVHSFNCVQLSVTTKTQPTRLLCPWGFPGKVTGVSCHFLLQEIFLTQRSNPHLLHWQADSLPLSQQGIWRFQRWIWIACVSVQLLGHVWLWKLTDWRPPGSSVLGTLQARILESVAISFSRGSSQPRDQTHDSYVSCNSRQILYHWATWEETQPSFTKFTVIHFKIFPSQVPQVFW